MSLAGSGGDGGRHGGVRHLYVHLPFCGHRCGYCDFVTLVGRASEHGRYVDALLAELELERAALAPRLETIFLGGGTPTFTSASEFARLLAALPEADEVTVEANPETVTLELAGLLREHGVTRVSVGAQSFRPHLLAVLERRATPAAVRAAVYALRDAGFDNISLDLLYGIPGQSAADLDRDLSDALALEPEHLSCYELEAKPGTRFTHTFGNELARQAEAMEDYFERVVDRPAPATAGTRPRTSASTRSTRKAAISASGTTSRTGAGGTTWGSGSALSRPFGVAAGARHLDSGRTSPPWGAVRRRRASWNRFRRPSSDASESSSGCVSTSRLRFEGSTRRSISRRSAGSRRSASQSGCGAMTPARRSRSRHEVGSSAAA